VRDRSERRILKALRERRREAYEGVIDAHYASVYRLLLFLTRNMSLAEDLTQEVFTSAWGAIDEFRGESSLKTWLRRIAYHSFVDVERRRGGPPDLLPTRTAAPVGSWQPTITVSGPWISTPPTAMAFISGILRGKSEYTGERSPSICGTCEHETNS
jgi:DNA-directed RNA polymerase specialized sigma24 family protein